MRKLLPDSSHAARATPRAHGRAQVGRLHPHDKVLLELSRHVRRVLLLEQRPKALISGFAEVVANLVPPGVVLAVSGHACINRDNRLSAKGAVVVGRGRIDADPQALTDPLPIGSVAMLFVKAPDMTQKLGQLF